jgi:hypothetical protein
LEKKPSLATAKTESTSRPLATSASPVRQSQAAANEKTD